MATKAELDVFVGKRYQSADDIDILKVANIQDGFVEVYSHGNIGKPWGYKERSQGRVRVWLNADGTIRLLALG